MAASRILADQLWKRSVREHYWAASRTGKRVVNLMSSTNRPFARVVGKDTLRFLLGAVRPIPGETQRRALAAVEWICRAQDATEDDGVAFGYFPCDGIQGWRASYPETTGYLITSLLEYAHRYRYAAARERALRMAHWEVQIQMANGAVQGGPVCPPEEQTPCVFNTGMVLDGWVTAYQETGDTLYVEAGRRAAEYLLSDMTEEGYFRTNGQFVASNSVKTYNCLCAWALYRLGDCTLEDRYRQAAVRAIEAALRQQHANGWFANNCLDRPEAPLLHTIGYTLQGILEVGILAGREDVVAALMRGVEPILSRISPKGFLPGRFYSDWEPASFSSCLTGSAQLAVVCYRLHEHTGVGKYQSAADRLLNFLKALQALDAPCPAINGALAGSFPIFGSYMTAGYPNWASKYFLDGLMFQDRLQGSCKSAPVS